MTTPATPVISSGVASPAHRGAVRVLVRVGAVAAVAPALAALQRWHDPGALCPLRRFTGIPCPACGSTTVLIELGGGHLAAAVAANPLTVLVGLGLLAAPLGPGRWWWGRAVRTQHTVIGAVVGLSWLWQLHRYGFLAL